MLINIIPKLYQCQHCGSDRKLVETIIDDEFIWNEFLNEFEPNKFMHEFEHTGNVRCSNCDKNWTGT